MHVPRKLVAVGLGAGLGLCSLDAHADGPSGLVATETVPGGVVALPGITDLVGCSRQGARTRAPVVGRKRNKKKD
ncbi:MAG: hypothetical protein VX000_07025, partial [Myxococcota bacterium]|nr:hypothetical protein [Myxococcota bacterium]